MQEDWELLAKDYEGDENILIAEVDCTVSTVLFLLFVSLSFLNLLP